MQDTGIYYEVVNTGIVTDIGLFASGIFNNLGQPSGNGVSISSISGWLATNIGQLNIAIEGNFQSIPESGFIFPALNFDAVTVYESMYNVKYYTRMVDSNLGASAYDWSEIQEEGSRIRRVSKNEIAKTYLQLVKETKELVNKQANMYRRNRTLPKAVTGDDDTFTPPLWNINMLWSNYPYGRYMYYWNWRY